MTTSQGVHKGSSSNLWSLILCSSHKMATTTAIQDCNHYCTTKWPLLYYCPSDLVLFSLHGWQPLLYYCSGIYHTRNLPLIWNWITHVHYIGIHCVYTIYSLFEHMKKSFHYLPGNLSCHCIALQTIALFVHSLTLLFLAIVYWNSLFVRQCFSLFLSARCFKIELFVPICQYFCMVYSNFRNYAPPSFLP